VPRPDLVMPRLDRGAYIVASGRDEPCLDPWITREVHTHAIGSALLFKIQKTTPLRMLRDEYCILPGVPSTPAMFISGYARDAPRCAAWHETAEYVGLEDDEVIVAYVNPKRPSKEEMEADEEADSEEEKREMDERAAGWCS